MDTQITGRELSIGTDTETVGTKQVQVLRCVGYVDANTFNTFQNAITRPLEQGQVNIVLDMSEITYIHSTGFGLLLTAQRQAQAGGGNLVIAGFAPRVANIFNLLGFDRIIHTFPTVAEALECFS